MFVLGYVGVRERGESVKGLGFPRIPDTLLDSPAAAFFLSLGGHWVEALFWRQRGFFGEMVMDLRTPGLRPWKRGKTEVPRRS